MGRGALGGFSGSNVPALMSQFFHKNCGTKIKKIVAEVNASEPPRVLKLRMGVSKGMLSVKCSNKSTYCVRKISLRSQCSHKDEVNLATPSFEVITGCKTMVSVCLSLVQVFIFHPTHI